MRPIQPKRGSETRGGKKERGDIDMQLALIYKICEWQRKENLSRLKQTVQKYEQGDNR